METILLLISIYLFIMGGYHFLRFEEGTGNNFYGWACIFLAGAFFIFRKLYPNGPETNDFIMLSSVLVFLLVAGTITFSIACVSWHKEKKERKKIKLQQSEHSEGNHHPHHVNHYAGGH